MTRASDTGVRLDKWLQVARVFKTRSQATRACNLNRVQINGQRAKPHRSLNVGDRIEVEIGDWNRVLVVRRLADRPVKKSEAAELFEDLSGPRPQLDRMARLLRRSPIRREAGAGRPTKRDRRKIDRLRDA